MRSKKQKYTRVIYAIESRISRLLFTIKRALGLINPAIIVPYVGYGTREAIYIRGRVIQQYATRVASAEDSAWRNLANMYQHFSTDDVPGAWVEARIGNVTAQAKSDAEGLFNITLTPDEAFLSQISQTGGAWHPVQLTLTHYPGPRHEDTTVTMRVMIPPDDAQFAVISDLDDTIIQTDVLHIVRMMRNTLFRNAHTRLPFEGVAAFYQALNAGKTGNAHNPIFYLSSSPSNLYPLITDFFKVRKIPAGPLFLTDIGLTRDYFFKPSHHQHKLAHIRLLMGLYPQLSFILIGDSGEADPDVYLQAAREFPNRVRVIYIRDVGRKRRRTQLAEIMQQVQDAGSEMLVVRDTYQAALHAATHGMIAKDRLAQIKHERTKDQPPQNPFAGF